MNDVYTPPSDRTHPEMREQLKIIFQYSLMLVSSFVGGAILPRLLGPEFWSMAETSVSTHFALPFDGIKGLGSILKITFSYFKPDFWCVLLVGIFTFSSLSCPVSDGVLLYLGARTGCSISVLYTLVKGNTQAAYQPTAFCFFLFAVFKLLLLACFLTYSVRMAQYAYRLRIYSKEGRVLFEPKAVWNCLLQMITATSILFVLHLLYGASIYFVSK